MNKIAMKRWMMGVLLLGLIAAPLSMSNLMAEEEKHDPLEDQMSAINSGYKVIRRSARKGEFSDTDAEAVGKMVINAAAAMHEKVPVIEKAPEAQRKAMYMEYKKQMGELTKKLVDLELLIIAGKHKEAAKLADTLGDDKKKGHDKFTEE